MRTETGPAESSDRELPVGPLPPEDGERAGEIIPSQLSLGGSGTY